jgi:hypothetical protein
VCVRYVENSSNRRNSVNSYDRTCTRTVRVARRRAAANSSAITVVDATCVAENAAAPEQRAAIDRFDEAKATYEPHRALYKHQDEQYRLMKDNLTDDHAMIVFDFSPYNATALQLTQEESHRSGMQVLHVVVIRRSTKARSTTTTGVFRSFVRCHFHIFATAGGNDLKFHYIDFVLESGSTNDYAFLKTALVRMSFVSSCVTI